MATRREKCQWCRVDLLVPVQAQAASCPYCQSINNYNYYSTYDTDHLQPVRYNIAGRVPAYRMPIQVSPPNVHGGKRAVLCGISYMGHSSALDGSVADVLSMKRFLVGRMGFPAASVIVLTEEEKDPYKIPTKSNIRRALSWLVHGCRAGDSVVFHYSGHASRVRDLNGDEIDGCDEALCPVDYETEGKMLDDEINALIVRPLPHGATLHAIIDTCFSGTFLDLPFMCRMNREGYYLWEDHRIPYTAYKGTGGGLAISISACDDDQNAGEANIFTGTATGALTHNFIQILERAPRPTYGYLLSAMRSCIHKARSSLPNGTVAANSVQEPQLSSSEQFDIHSKQLVL